MPFKNETLSENSMVVMLNMRIDIGDKILGFSQTFFAIVRDYSHQLNCDYLNWKLTFQARKKCILRLSASGA